MVWRSLWLRLLIIPLLLGGAAAGWASYREYQRGARIQSEIDALQKEADRVDRENATLSEKIEYFASPDYQESVAKEKLGLRRQEETVLSVNIPEGDLVPARVMSIEERHDDRIMNTLPNYRKWWNHFFRVRTSF